MSFKRGKVCSDRKQCLTPTRHGINEVIIEGLRNSPHSCRRELYNCGIISVDDKRSAILLPRMSQTCSIGLLSGEYAGHSIRRIPSSKKKFSTCRVGAVIDRHTGSNHNSAKSGIFVHKFRIIPSATFSPDDNPTIFRFYTKAGLVREEHVAPKLFPNSDALGPPSAGSTMACC
ncbi:hypothetical protein AVEN_32437-1 [Araneus ventricosus]|uniref:Uncharacterized protein n=1 Tax=Araneus ventricosus TaxID=182803 RepID=A0A4Y2NTZ0_ARAVE|nr:hypothetical protein AVEN_32437-1 [Araneus ventricosus]